MNKKAWPYIGSTESGMGVREYGDYRDMQHGSYERSDANTPEKQSIEGTGPATATILSGKQFALNEEEMEDKDLLDSAFSVDEISDNSNILIISDDCDSIKGYARSKYNIFHISKKAELESSIIISKKADPRYYKYDKKFDLFLLNNNFDNDSFKLCLSNITNQLKNYSKGVIKTSLKSTDVFATLSSFNMKVDNFKNNIYKVSFNNLKNTKIVGVMDLSGAIKATFICDIADSMDKKIAGLQAYSNINKSFGLYFPYNKATDVSYHMGTVNYPIDIIFLDNELTVKKIDKNISPGTPGLFSCGGVKAVLELNGNMSNILNIKVGDQVFVDSADNLNSNTIEKNIAIKKTTSAQSRLSKFGSVGVKFVGSEGLAKTASLLMNTKEYKYAILDIDPYLGLYLNLRKEASYDKHSLLKDVFGRPKTAEKNNLKVDLLKIAKAEIPEGYFLPETISGFNDMINLKISRDLKNLVSFDGKIVIASKHNLDYSSLSGFLNSYSRLVFRRPFPIFEFTKIADDTDLYQAITQKYNNNDLYFLNKKAGAKIPKNIADKAKEAEESLKEAIEKSEKLMEALKKNLTVYQSIESDKERVKNSKFDYKESVGRNKNILKEMLLAVKEGLKKMNEIKDISTTYEIIGTIATASTKSSEIVAEIFELIDIIETDDFIPKLSEKTGMVEKIFMDLKNSIQRMTAFINNDILGVLVISP